MSTFEKTCLIQKIYKKLNMDEEEIAVLSEFLSIKSQSGFSIRISRKPKYVQLFKASRNGIERLEISDGENDKNTRIVTLENCVKITVEPSPNNMINIVTKTGQIQLHSNNETALKQWKVALQSVAFKEKSPKGGIVSHDTIIEEDNDLYCSSYSESIFTVKLIPTDASIKCGLESKLYTLMLSSSDILLKSYDDESFVAARWPYRFIRKYGYRDGKFTFEAGRMCDTGEGTFKLDNSNPQEIFRCMATIMKSMKNKMSGGTSNKSNQLNVALRMEAGSRSPIPPMTPETCIDAEYQNSFRNFVSSSDITSISNKSIAALSIPCKPPRKVSSSSLNSKFLRVLSEEHCHNSFDKSKELVDDFPYNVPSPCKNDREYECVEDITEAWKKFGMNYINHTEKMSDDEMCSPREFNTKHRLDKSKINDNIMNSSTDETYDKLNFFRTTYKSSGYKTIVPINPHFTPKPFNVKISDDYEIVGESNISLSNGSRSSGLENFDDNSNHMSPTEPDISACRKADDSHLGYGTIRRQTEEENNITQLTYSTVFKQKRA